MPVYSSAPPDVGAITGSGLSSTYGMPTVQYYDVNGTQVDEETASYLSGGTYMEIPASNIAELPTGIYFGYINNAVSGGGTSAAGVVETDVVGPVSSPFTFSVAGVLPLGVETVIGQFTSDGYFPAYGGVTAATIGTGSAGFGGDSWPYLILLLRHSDNSETPIDYVTIYGTDYIWGSAGVDCNGDPVDEDFSAGDRLVIQTPNPQDSTLADVSLTFAFTY